jgi:hypothetical protein
MHTSLTHDCAGKFPKDQEAIGNPGIYQPM